MVAVFGGVPYDPQAKRIRKGVDLLVATPGRLLDMLRQGDVLLDKVDTLVLDEADRMLDMGFWPDVKRIIDAIPARAAEPLLLGHHDARPCSASSRTPCTTRSSSSSAAAPCRWTSVEQRVLPVNQDQKVELLVGYFQHHDPERTLVFTRTQRRAERLSNTLNKAGIKCEAIHGDRSQGQRQEALERLQGRPHQRARGHRRRRPRHRRRRHHARHQLRHPDQPRGLRAPHRAHRPRGRERDGRQPADRRGRGTSCIAIERLIGSTLERHDLPGFDYEKRNILESSQVTPRAGKLVWNGGAHRAWNKTGVKRRVPGKRSR